MVQKSAKVMSMEPNCILGEKNTIIISEWYELKKNSINTSLKWIEA